MQHNLYSVYDSKAAVFCAPFTSENDHTALRAFKYAANDKTQEIGRYPSDFTLFRIGTFSTDSGSMGLVEPTSIALAITLIDQPEVIENVG